MVDISSRALDNHPSFALKVLEHILMTRLPDHPEFPAYSESVKELHGLASHELRRLAIRYAEYFAVSTVQAPKSCICANYAPDVLRAARTQDPGNNIGQSR